jgi:serine protease AprX
MRHSLILLLAASLTAAGDLTQLARIDIEKATLDDVVKLAGEPEAYIGRTGQKLSKAELPAVFLARFAGRIEAMVLGREVQELRFHTPGIAGPNGIEVGWSLEQAMKAVGPPTSVVEGQPRADFGPGVLYKDIGGEKGRHYFHNDELRVRMFFHEGKVSALYLVRKRGQSDRGGPRPPVVTELKKFDDIRHLPSLGMPRDASRLDLTGMGEVLPTLTFNRKSQWPAAERMPKGVDPVKLLETGMDPGLGIRGIHRQGITGKGVNVAILDQSLYTDHPEYAAQIAAYHDTGSGSDFSMHGPAVASLLVGANTGTAPGARLYFSANPQGLAAREHFAKGLEWVLEENRKLPAGRKIRVVSVSAAPSGKGSPFGESNPAWDQLVERAEREDVVVLDCTGHHGITQSCWFEGDRDKPSGCTPGFPGLMVQTRPGRLAVPSSPRTTAEEYVKGDFGYQYTGRGGLSWTTPYVAGVLALGWEVRPELRGKRMLELLFESAYVRPDGTKVIDPPAFVKLVKAAR